MILGAIDAEAWIFVAVMLLSSVLTLAYFANVIRYMYFPASAEDDQTPATDAPFARLDAPMEMLIPIVCILGLGILNGEIVSLFLEPAVPASFVQ